MSKAKNWLTEKLFWLQTGTPLQIANDGNPVDTVVIRYKDFFIEVMLDAETGTPVDFGWSEDRMMFHSPIREDYIARQEQL